VYRWRTAQREKRPFSSGKFDEYFDRLLSDSESEETNFKLHVCNKNNFIWWNHHHQNACRFETTSFVTSKGTAFRMLCQESLIFRESHSWIKQLLLQKL